MKTFKYTLLEEREKLLDTLMRMNIKDRYAVIDKHNDKFCYVRMSRALGRSGHDGVRSDSAEGEAPQDT